jgi:putative hemolysin
MDPDPSLSILSLSLDILLVLFFIGLSTIFVAAEIALVTLREGQVRQLAGKGKRGSRVAELAKDPNRFLAAVQVGVTLFGFLSAAVGADHH